MMNEYTKMAEDFLKNHDAKMTISHIYDYGAYVKSTMTGGWLYRVRIDRRVGDKNRSWSFKFSDSKYNALMNKRPEKYDVLACIQKYEPYGDVWDFANEYGYEINDRESFNETSRIYKAVKKEYENVMRIFGDCIEELREVQ